MGNPVGEVKVCPSDGEPVVFTFEFPGAEHFCVVCGWLGGLFGPPTAAATPELTARLGELNERYDREYAARRGVPYRPRPTPDVMPVCAGCDRRPTVDEPLRGDKPAHWYSRKPEDGEMEYACSKACIERAADEKGLPTATMPW